MLIGVVSDTHGYLDHRLLTAFRSVEAIVHAGDVGSVDVLEGLGQLAPLFAVRGNNDEAAGGLGLPECLDITLADLRLQVVHELPQARPEPETRVVIFGHSHRQVAEWRDGILYLNPGAAGRVGFHPLQTAALLQVEGGATRVELLELGPRQKRLQPKRPAAIGTKLS